MGISTTEPSSAQSELSSDGGMVTANQHFAAEAGARILARGGNAMDAAAATAFAAGVVEPAMSGLGGRGYIVIYLTENGSSAVVDGHERAPLAARPDMFTPEVSQQIPTQGWGPQVPVVGAANIIGPKAVAVPGVLGGLAVAHARYGRLPLADVMEPAIALAADGFEVGVPLATTIAQNRAKLARFPATAEIFLPNGFPPAAGQRLIQSDLAASLRRIAANGPEEFYTGSIARSIAAEMERSGGIMTRQDLAEFEPRVWDNPLIGTYRGYQVLTVPEATGGITILQILNLLEGFDLSATESLDASTLHLLLEACRIAFQDRLAVIEDPAFVPVPYAGLASKDFAAQRRALISMEKAMHRLDPADPWPFDDRTFAAPTARLTAYRPSEHDTTHFCVVDQQRMIVSMTQSIIDAFGSGVVVPGTGILLNSAMHNFNPIPGQLGSIAPWKRSVHSGSPTIVLRADGSPCLAIGGAGGTKIPTGIVQILTDVLDRGRPIQEAVAAPRVHNEGWESQIDGRIPDRVISRLRAMGHQLEVLTPRYALPAFSRINAIALGPAGLTSGVDPFTDAGAAAI